MPWWLDMVLLLSGALLWGEGSNHPDDVIGLLEKILAVTAVMVVLLGGRQLPLEVGALLVAAWLPSARRYEERRRS
jgi:hypothetical protein